MRAPAPAAARRFGGSPQGVAAAAGGLALLYGALSPVHLVVLTGVARPVMATVAAVGALLLAGAALRVRRAGRLSSAGLSAWSAAVCTVPVVNSLTHIAVTRDLGESSTLVLVLVGIGAAVGDRRLAALLTAVAGTAWLLLAVLVLQAHGAPMVHHGAGLAMGAALGAILNVMRAGGEASLRALTAGLREEADRSEAALAALTVSEERFRNAFLASPVGMGLGGSDGRFVAANDALCAVLGRPPEDVLGHSAVEFVHPDDHATTVGIRAGVDAQEDGVLRLELRLVRPDGELRWVWLTATGTTGPDGEAWTLAHVQDITGRRAGLQALRRSEELLADAERLAGLGSWELQLPTMSLLWSDQMFRLFGHDPATAHASLENLAASLHPEDRDRVLSTVRGAIERRESFSVLRYRIVLPDGAVRHLDSSCQLHFGPDGEPLVARGTALDVTDRVTREAALHELATTDGLTGLPNRRAWDERIDAELDRAHREALPLTVAIIDLDNFKRFNDTHGHAAGDRLLAGFAARARAALRADDVLARWGGEEFVVALPQCAEKDADAVLSRVLGAMPGDETCSIGFATWDGAETADELLRRADDALYAAKTSGRARSIPAPRSSPEDAAARERVAVAPAGSRSGG